MDFEPPTDHAEVTPRGVLVPHTRSSVSATAGTPLSSTSTATAAIGSPRLREVQMRKVAAYLFGFAGPGKSAGS